jgi:hypothetical protein
MSANILNRDTQVGIEMAWHKLTNVVPKIDRSNCGIVYAMEKQPLFLPNGTPTEHYGIVSSDDGQMIGNPVKKNYKLISNERMFDLVESSMAGTSHEIVSIGSIGNREKVFCSIKLSENIVAGNRETENVLNVLWGHGGVFGVTARSGFTVVVCANTFAMAIGGKAEFRLDCKHTGNADSKIANMAKAIDAHFGVTAEFKQAMDSLAGQPITKATARQVIAGFIVRDEKPEEVSTRSANTINEIESLFNRGKGNKGNDLCDLFNGFTDYYSHASSGGDDRFKQFASSEFGSGNRAKGEAFDLLTGETVAGIGDLDATIKRGDRVLQLV